ncbi:hypothetical protein N7468_001278 [Penicillium chermesinum]|uniref:Ankyrin repeat protein n=1 Tax=Penicillium chermesinum TaxID=63820 RepID=A0A9W9TWM3_9EURO|nr:uncharacterized protein N7468_001278 [Penicillium chermesinum]KAJ5246295.1 hypothetical protein N7468_001278 [Penicillium chermesinum]
MPLPSYRGVTSKAEAELGSLLDALDLAALYFEECEVSINPGTQKKLALFTAILLDLAKLQKGCSAKDAEEEVGEDISALVSDITFGVTVMSAEMMMYIPPPDPEDVLGVIAISSPGALTRRDRSSQNNLNQRLQRYIVDLCTGERKANAITTVFDRSVPAKKAWEGLARELESIDIPRTQSTRERDMIIMTLYKAAMDERLLKNVVFKPSRPESRAPSPKTVPRSSQTDRMSLSSTSSPTSTSSIKEASTAESIPIPVAVEIMDRDSNVKTTVPLEGISPGDKTSLVELAELSFNVFDKNLFGDFSSASSIAPRSPSLDASPTSPTMPSSRAPRRTSVASSKRPSVSSKKPSISSVPEHPSRNSSDSDRAVPPHRKASSAHGSTGKRTRHASIAESSAESQAESITSTPSASAKPSTPQPTQPFQVIGTSIRSKRPSLMSRMKFKMTNNKDEFSQLIKNGGPFAVKCALDKGASVHTENSSGQTGLITAAAYGHDDIIVLLLEHGASIDAMGPSGETALSVAASKGYDDIVQLLLLHGADPNSGAHSTGKTALSQAAALGHYNAVRILLNFGADPNALCASDDTALTHAAVNDRLKVAQLLLERGAIPDKTGYTGKTPLWRTVHKGSLRMIKLLLENGADPNRKDIRQQSPLVLAIQQGRTDVIGLFYQFGYGSGEGFARSSTIPVNGDLEFMRDGVSHRLSIFNN